MRQATPEDADKTILALALEHRLVTRLTDFGRRSTKPPGGPEGETLKLTELPLNLPAGWDFAKVFGERPQPLSPRLEQRTDSDSAPVRLARAEAKRVSPVVAPAPGMVQLPKTATDAELKMIAGSILLALGLRHASGVHPAADPRTLTPDDRRGPSPPLQ